MNGFDLLIGLVAAVVGYCIASLAYRKGRADERRLNSITFQQPQHVAVQPAMLRRLDSSPRYPYDHERDGL